MAKKSDTVLISGYARLPAHITSEEVYHTAVVAVLVNMESGTVIKCEVSTVTSLASEFVSRLIVGYRLDEGAEGLVERFDRLYFGQMKKAIITAIKMIFARYEEICAQVDGE